MPFTSWSLMNCNTITSERGQEMSCHPKRCGTGPVISPLGKESRKDRTHCGSLHVHVHAAGTLNHNPKYKVGTVFGSVCDSTTASLTSTYVCNVSLHVVYVRHPYFMYVIKTHYIISTNSEPSIWGKI